MTVWERVTEEADRTGHVTVTKHILREMFDTAPASVAAAQQRDKVPAMESMLAAALRRIEHLEAELAALRAPSDE